MRKLFSRVLICALLALFVWVGTLLADKQLLRQELIRLHVVANSDSEADQSVKLMVRDAVMEHLEQGMKDITDYSAAKAYLEANLPVIQTVANEALRKAGVDMDAAVTLCREAFEKRVYDTFSLPAGIYRALRITIGEGEGKNWWCVVFPSFCMDIGGENFEDRAVSAGFSGELAQTLSGEGDYEVRFYFLDKLGQLENILFAG
jgi:stage II sporulation protein R